MVGQKISLSEELDGKDWGCEHYLLSVNDAPVGVARVRFIADYAKIERVGILEAYQGKGLGRRMMNVILSNLEQDARVSTAKLSSQTHAISFYEHLGFIVCSDAHLSQLCALNSGLKPTENQFQLIYTYSVIT